jgi:hypothetical protein
VKSASDEKTPAGVSPLGTKQVGETRPTQWSWVEHSVWITPKASLEAIEKGVKGGVWYSLIDHQRWINNYFQDLGLFSLEGTPRTLLQSSRGRTTDRKAGCGRSAWPVCREG